VFWVHASNTARFEEAYRNIADRLQLPGRRNPTVNVLQLVYNWLCSSSSGRWVIILDNCDDWSILYPRQDYGRAIASTNTQSSSIALARFLPQSQNGSVVITSRSMEVATGLTGGVKDIIKVQPMNENQAIQLLRNKLSDPSNEVTEIARLVLALDYMPLAITQAAGYINQLSPRISVAKYLEELSASEDKRERLLIKSTSDLYRDAFAFNSVLTTWQISFDYIRQERPSAADLLSFISFFNQQGIPEFMLRYYAESIESTCTRENHEGFEEDIALLRGFLLVTVNTSGDVFEMHQLVQFAIRMWLRSFGNESKGWETFLSALSKEFPTGDYSNWSKCQILFPHVEALMSREPEDRVPLRDWSQILAYAAWYAMTQGLYVQAEDMARKSVAGREKVLEKDDPLTLTSIMILAVVLQHQGKYEEAERLNRRALEGSEKALGKEHPFTLTSVNNLASVLRDQGKYEVAERLNRRALEGSERVLGNEHPLTLKSVNNLASVLQNQGKYEEAERLNRRALEGSEKALGKEHPETSTIVNNLAAVLRDQGKYEEAERLNRRTLEGSEKALGKEHPETLTIVNNLALVLQGQGKYEVAERLNRRALEGSEKALGKEHPETLTIVNNLALVLQGQGKYEVAERLNRRALGGSEKVLGNEHPLTLKSVNNLASVLQDQRKYEEAERLNRRALEGREKVLGKEHPETLQSVNNLASVLQDQGKYEEAERLNRRALEGSEKALGKDLEERQQPGVSVARPGEV